MESVNGSNVKLFGSKEITVSLGNNFFDNNPNDMVVTLEQVFSDFLKPAVRGPLKLDDYLVAEKEVQIKQKDGKWFNTAEFSSGRSLGNVVSMSGFVLDIDTGEISEEYIKSALKGYVYIAHTSYSNSPSKIKWRILLPYTEKITADYHYSIYSFLQKLFNNQLDDKCQTASQIWYLPSYPPGGGDYYRCFSNGIVEDEKDSQGTVKLFDPMSVPLITKTDEKAGEQKLVTKEKFDISKEADAGGRFDQLNKYTWGLLHEKRPLHEIFDLLVGYNNTHCKPPHDKKELRRIYDNAVSSFQKKCPQAYNDLKTKSKRLPAKQLKPLSEIMQTEYPELKWAIDGFIPEGLTILAAAPKTGKSFFCYGLCIAIALGEKAFGTVDVEQGKAVYLALEDNEVRLKNRAKLLFESYGHADVDCTNLLVQNEYNRFEQGGLEDLDDVLSNNPDVRIVVIDTLIQMQSESSKQNQYADDYNSVVGLRSLAAKHRVAIVVVHHLTKKESENPFNQITGSVGLQGCVDSMIIIKMQQSKYVMHIAGRDVEKQELLLDFDVEHPGAWSIQGDSQKFAEAVKISPTRKNILAAMSETPMGPKEIWEKLGGPESTHSQPAIRQQLVKMLKDGQVEQPEMGLYVLPKQDEDDAEESDDLSSDNVSQESDESPEIQQETEPEKTGVSEWHFDKNHRSTTFSFGNEF